MVDTGVTSGNIVAYSLSRLLKHLKAILLLLRVPKPVFLYIGGAGGFGLYYQGAVAFVARLRKIPIIFHHHSYNYLRSSSMTMRFLSHSAGANAHHIALSADMGERLSSLYPNASHYFICSNALFVHPNVELEALAPPLLSPITFGHLSNITYEKGIDDVLDAFREAGRYDPSVKLLIGGPIIGKDAESLVQAAIEEACGRIEYLGPVDQLDIPNFMSRISVFLFPSRYRHEAEPLVVLEAASSGVPTIGRDIGSLGTLLSQLGGRSVAMSDSFAAAVVRLLPALITPRSRQLVLTGFMELRMSAQCTWNDLQREVLDRQRIRH